MEAQPQPEQVDIAVVGGGFAGLTVAIGLQKYPHLNVHVYEAAHQFSEVGSGILLGPNAQDAMDLIDFRLKQGFESRAVFGPDTPDENGLYTWFSLGKGEEPDLGEHIVSYKHKYRISSIHRADFLDELVKLVDPAKCHFGKRLDAVFESDSPDRKIGLHFKDGDVAWADIVIGADGVHSMLRKHILGAKDPAAEAAYTGTMVYRALVSVEEVEKKLGYIPRRIDSLCGTHAHIIHFPVSGGKQYFLGVTVHDVPKTNSRETLATPEAIEQAKAIFGSWNDESRKLAELLPEGKTDAWPIHDMYPASTYYKGRVAILGDAAHASSPHQGSGASSAIEDALILEKLLGKYLDPSERGKENHLPLSTTVPLIFQAYDTVRRFRSQKIVYSSRRSGRIMGGLEPGVGDSAEDIRAALQGVAGWIWNFDQEGQVRDAFQVYESARRGVTSGVDP